MKKKTRHSSRKINLSLRQFAILKMLAKSGYVGLTAESLAFYLQEIYKNAEVDVPKGIFKEEDILEDTKTFQQIDAVEVIENSGSTFFYGTNLGKKMVVMEEERIIAGGENMATKKAITMAIDIFCKPA